nr:unnamed protein product [Callosobruchus analis]
MAATSQLCALSGVNVRRDCTKMALTRKDRIIALLPPMTSDGSDSSDDEEIPVKLHDVIDSSDTDTSEAPSIPEQAAAAMEDIMNN